MFILLFLSLLQICFIPGFIFYVVLNRKSSDANLLLVPVFSFGLSLIINYIIVFILTYFHLYTLFSLTVLLTIEFIIIIWLFTFRKVNIDAYNLGKTIGEGKNEIILLLKGVKSPYNLLKFILLISSALLLLYLLNILISNTGKIFDSWDAVFSWNRWANDFYNNKMPLRTYHYPQLIPANWSIAYVLCGYPFQIVPKMIMHLFLIFQVYTFIVLGISQRSALYFIAAIIVFQIFKIPAFRWTDGFVDIAVSFFSLMVFVSLLSIKSEHQEIDKFKYFIISALIACGAAVTKQSGLFVVLMYPTLLLILAKRKIEWNFRVALKYSLYFLLIIMLVALTYLWASMEIKSGHSTSEIGYVTQDIFKGASYYERFTNACLLFYNLYLTKLLLGLSFLFLLLSFSDKSIGLITILFTIPFYFIWALFFSYDIRNLAIVLPILALTLGKGIDFILIRSDRILEIGKKAIVGLIAFFENKILLRLPSKKTTIHVSAGHRLSSKRILHITLLICVAAGTFYLNKKVDRERLINSQNYRLKELGEIEINNRLYIYHEKNPINKSIITDYHFLQFLPEIGNYYKYGELKNLKPTHKNFSDESVGFLLWNPDYKKPEDFPEFIESGIASGLYEEIFNYNGYRFIKIR